MNTSATTAIRELNAQELDQVTGGINYNLSEEGGLAATAAIFTAMFAIAVGGLLEWLFG